MQQRLRQLTRVMAYPLLLLRLCHRHCVWLQAVQQIGLLILKEHLRIKLKENLQIR